MSSLSATLATLVAPVHTAPRVAHTHSLEALKRLARDYAAFNDSIAARHAAHSAGGELPPVPEPRRPR